MNRFFSRTLALSLLTVPLSLIARAQTAPKVPDPLARPTPTPRPTRTPKPGKTPKATATPKPTKTPRPTPIPTRTPIPVSVSEADNGKTVFVARGGLVELRLASNPSTGYGWSVVSERNLKLEGEAGYEATPVAPKVVGSGGFSVFRFRAVKNGTGDLALDLRSPAFKTGDKAAKEFRAIVRVLK